MLRENYIKRFHTNYTISDDGCWIWDKSCNPQGYASTKLKEGEEIIWMGHRVSYHLFKGPIPEGMVVMHSCDNPSCVNPDHLSAGSRIDNVNDMVQKGRSLNCGRSGVTEQPRKRRSKYVFNDRRGVNNNQAKLTWHIVRQIRRRKGATLHQISSDYGISVTQAHRIRNNLCWIE